MIEPSVGRVVWLRVTKAQVDYWRSFGSSTHKDVCVDTHGNQPLAATVAYVHGPRMVNLAAVDHNGVPFSVTSVTLLQDDDQPNGAGMWAEWMPYQKGQAAKTETLEAEIASRTA